MLTRCVPVWRSAGVPILVAVRSFAKQQLATDVAQMNQELDELFGSQFVPFQPLESPFLKFPSDRSSPEPDMVASPFTFVDSSGTDASVEVAKTAPYPYPSASEPLSLDFIEKAVEQAMHTHPLESPFLTLPTEMLGASISHTAQGIPGTAHSTESTQHSVASTAGCTATTVSSTQATSVSNTQATTVSSTQAVWSSTPATEGTDCSTEGTEHSTEGLVSSAMIERALQQAMHAHPLESPFLTLPSEVLGASMSNAACSSHSTAASVASKVREPAANAAASLTHVDSSGAASMVNVGEKPDTERVAVASGRVLLGPQAFSLVQANQIKKGDVLTVAKLAGMMGAKHTSLLIPLCHNISLTQVDVHLELDPSRYAVQIRGLAKTVGKTGVEMEALTAVSVAALTVYDMCKAVTKDAVIESVRLEAKSGGRSGDYKRS